MALGQTAGCPRVYRAKKFMCSPRNAGNINFPLWLTGGLSQGCPDVQKVYVFKVYVPFACPRNRLRSLCGNDAVAVAMHFAMKNGQIRFSLRKFLAISSAIQKIASDCGFDAVVHSGPRQREREQYSVHRRSFRGCGEDVSEVAPELLRSCL